MRNFTPPRSLSKYSMGKKSKRSLSSSQKASEQNNLSPIHFTENMNHEHNVLLDQLLMKSNENLPNQCDFRVSYKGSRKTEIMQFLNGAGTNKNM